MKNFSLLFLFFSAFVALSFSPHFEYENKQETSSADSRYLTHVQREAMEEHRQLEMKYDVRRGERPPIDLNRLPEDVFEKGKIKIKLKPYMGKAIPAESITAGKSSFVETGVASLDKLNEVFSVQQYNQMFTSLYKASDRSEQFRDRHKAWGFHLWFEVVVDPKTDIKQAVSKFQALPEVEIAEPFYKKVLYDGITDETSKTQKDNEKWIPNDPELDNQWHYNNTGQAGGTPGADISLFEAWDLETGHTDVIVSIQDGGIQLDHPDLEDNIWSGIGYNFVDDNSTITPHDHGAHVAGTVAAVNNNNIGVAGVAGGTGSGDGIRLMSTQVFTGSSSGGFHLAPVYAADNDAAISQNSWGYTSEGYYDQPVLDAIDYFNANGGGDVMDGGITIFAAGNSDASGDWYPGCYEGAFAVAATNNQDVISNFGWGGGSNYGEWVDISAPGGETFEVTERGVLSTITNNGYAYYQGTSMACPHASGVAALIISKAYRNGIILENSEVAEILKLTTDDHYDVNPGYEGMLGTGRLNAYAAVIEIQDMVSGIINPRNLTATPLSISQIDISWELNDDGNEVLFAWSEDGSFGEPGAGTVYDEGEDIPGGGTVLYRGAGTEYSHTDLEGATTYYYRAFSYNTDYEYSSGRGVSAQTYLPPHTIPYTENFDYSAGVIPPNWELVGVAHNWGVSNTNDAGGNAPEMRLDWSPSATGLSRLATHSIDVHGYQELTMSFKQYLRYYSGSDEIIAVDVSFDGGQNWEELWFENFSNDVGPDEYEIVIDVPEGEMLMKLAFRFEGNSFNIWEWSIDDIEITGEQGDLLYTLDLEADPEDGGSPSGGGAYEEGEQVTLNANPNEGYVFVNWTEQNNVISTQELFDYNMPGQSITLVANFEELLLGDANNDGVVNVSDIVMIVNYILGYPSLGFNEDAADVTQDGEINIDDVVGVANIIMGGTKRSTNEVESETAYVWLDQDCVHFENDGTVAGLQFEIVADNADEINIELMQDDLQLAYRSNGNIITGLVYTFDNTSINKGNIKLLRLENHEDNFQWGDVKAANYNAQSIDVQTKDVTSVSSPSFHDINVEVFPNPSTGIFTTAIDLPYDAKVEIRLFDIMGKEKYSEPSLLLNTGRNEINISQSHNLSKGFHIMRITGFEKDSNRIIFKDQVKVLVE